MLNSYKIIFQNREVGTATVEEKGLYCDIHCICKIDKAGLYRVRLKNGSSVLDLGTCLRNSDCYVIQTRIPKSKLLENDLSFYLTEKTDEAQEVFIPIILGQPFEHISKLPDARLEVDKNTVGIICQVSVQQDNGQNQTHR